MRKVSQLLKETRLAKGISVEDVFRETKIQPKILKFLEEGDWQNLPEESYLKGLIKNYGEFLGLEKETLLALFRREYKKEEKDKPIWPKFSFRFSPSSNFLLVLGTAFLILVMFTYLSFQYFSQVLGPKLHVSAPHDGLVVETGEVEVRGKTDPDAQVYINGGKIEISGDGNFSFRLSILEEVTTIEVIARNKFGREKKVTRAVRKP